MNDLGPAGDLPRPVEVEFRPGPGGKVTREWAAYMMHEWWAAGDKKLSFGEAAKRAAVHFMVNGGQS